MKRKFNNSTANWLFSFLKLRSDNNNNNEDNDEKEKKIKLKTEITILKTKKEELIKVLNEHKQSNKTKKDIAKINKDAEVSHSMKWNYLIS